MRIACVDNISAAAYRLLRPDFPVVWINTPPAGTVDAILKGFCDAALVPVAELPRLAHVVSPAGPFGIAASGPVRSVLYLGQRAPRELIERDEAVCMAAESRTARALFPLLCHISYGRAPRISPKIEDAAACVVIGNEALRLSRNAPPSTVIVDLAEWWHTETGLPFVFAQWVLRRTLPSRQRHRLRDWLEHTTACAETPEGRGLMAHEVRDLGFTHDQAVEYYRGLQYRLNGDHRLGLAAFLNMQEGATQWAANA